MHSLYLILASAAIAIAHAWITPAPTTHAIRHSVLHRQQHVVRHAKTVDDDDEGATTIVQRTFYRFSPGSDVEVHHSMVLEDRYTVDGGGDTTSSGHRTILLRDGNVEEGEIGDTFYSITPETSLSTSEIAMALYLASNPTLCTEDMLEVSSETGLASILGCVGAGFVLQRNNPDASPSNDVADDILTISSSSHNDKLLPKTLEKLTLTASDERHLDGLMRNSKHSGIASNKLAVEPLDWRVKQNTRNTGVPPEVTTMVAVDLALTYPEAVSLARTCAYRLRPSWVGRNVNQVVPTFVHMCPAEREDAAYLQRELTTNYKMSAFTGYLKLEKLIFCPQTVPRTADMQTTLEDMELEVQEERDLTFSSLVAQHHPDYVGGGSGELFFPADTGATGFREAESSW